MKNERIGMSKEDVIQWCKCVEGAEGCCVYRCKKKQRKRRRKCRRMYGVKVVVVEKDGKGDDGRKESRIDGNSESYESYMARNERYHMYLEEEHPRC
jgi:hypothetical protein